VATWADVRRIALALPETIECGSDGSLQWQVNKKGSKKGFVWERPLWRGDLEALGDAAPDGPILAVAVPDIGVVDALLADNPSVYFITPHFSGYPAVLVRLERISFDELEELVVEAWLARATKRMVKAFLASADSPRDRQLGQASGA
jgi:hypothetical protein